MGIWFSVFTLSATHLSTATAVQSLHPSKDLESWFSGQVTGITSGGAGKCIEKNVDIHASAMNTKLNFELPVNQSQVTETIVEFLQVNATLLSEILGPKQNISGTYSISTKLCWPASLSSPNTSTIQLLTHGVGFDKCYWDFYSASYSYQNAAAKAGYTTLSYDRLGVGASDHPDPIQIVQAPLEIEIAHQLIQSLRHGPLPRQRTHKRHHLQIPSDLDAAVLTGFSVDTTGQSNFFSGLNLVIAREDQPLRFSELNNGYLISQSVVSNQFGFFRAPNFDPLVLAAAEASKQTFTLGELFTNGMFVSEAKEFRGPIDVVDGENDLPFCQSNCLVPHDKAAVVKAALYPNAKGTSTSYVAEGAGHGLNLHYVAVEAYQQIFEFLKGNGF
ncbi:hypothetical protein N431DRAFT_478041 [Stipitochalara longipes BDJ]|nr:hypothetical protein N431DRAFT_478041 [Stipitochalara longipes BDJ]